MATIFWAPPRQVTQSEQGEQYQRVMTRAPPRAIMPETWGLLKVKSRIAAVAGTRPKRNPTTSANLTVRTTGRAANCWGSLIRPWVTLSSTLVVGHGLVASGRRPYDSESWDTGTLKPAVWNVSRMKSVRLDSE